MTNNQKLHFKLQRILRRYGKTFIFGLEELYTNIYRNSIVCESEFKMIDNVWNGEMKGILEARTSCISVDAFERQCGYIKRCLSTLWILSGFKVYRAWIYMDYEYIAKMNDSGFLRICCHRQDTKASREYVWTYPPPRAYYPFTYNFTTEHVKVKQKDNGELIYISYGEEYLCEECSIINGGYGESYHVEDVSMLEP